ncbi:MAG: Hpt domain-containing protein [Azoarcus sp.]|jgi:chemosensory pili system protein ChpA (sensor histidine kinase/response regulator)|nr:Hpt domain-containing protein [Azoarcus sp.]
MMPPNEPDLGPLTWVKSEIDQALSHATESLQAATGSADAPAKVQFAQTHLHQVNGALSIIGLDGLTKFGAVLDLFLAALAQGEIQPDEAQIALGRRALASIGNYLEELIHGAPDQPLRLLPLYRELVLARGEAAPSPADLFFPNLDVRVPPRNDAPKPDTDEQQQRRAMRLRFQRGLLDWLRQPNADSADALRGALAGLEAVEDNPGMRSLWWAGQAFIDTLTTVPADEQPVSRLLLTRLEAQLHRIGESQQVLPERLLRELLYQVACLPASTPLQQAVRQAWQLDALIPEEGAQLSDLPLAPLLEELRAQLARIKDIWNTFGEQGASALSEFSGQLEAFTKSTVPLGRPVLYRLLGGMSRFITWLNANPDRYSEPIALEFATALLLAEAVLDRGLPDPGLQTQAGDALSRLEALARGETLAAPPSATSVKSARHQQEKEAIAQLSKEILSSLSTIEQTLDDFFRDHSKRAPLETLQAPLHQIEGALSLLGENDAISLIRESGEIIARLADESTSANDAELTELARRFSALGFFIQSLPYNRSTVAHFLSPAATPARTEPIAAGLSVQSNLPAASTPAKPLARASSAPPDGIESFPSFEIETEGEPQAKASSQEHSGEAAQEPAADAASQISPPQELPPEFDSEMLAIFIEEAHEILDTVIEHLKLLHASPGNHDNLTVIRRGFHTLKGSGRMVGLTDLGEAAWGLEQTLNRWLQLEWQVTPPLLKLLAIAHREFSAWINQIDKKTEYSRDVSTLLAEAERMRDIGAAADEAAPSAADEQPQEEAEPEAAGFELEFAPEQVGTAEPEQADEGQEFGIELKQTADETENRDESLPDTFDFEFPNIEEQDFAPAQEEPEEAASEANDGLDVISLEEPQAPEKPSGADEEIRVEPIAPPESFRKTASEPPAKAKRPAVPKFEPFDFSPFSFDLSDNFGEANFDGLVKFDLGISESKSNIPDVPLPADDAPFEEEDLPAAAQGEESEPEYLPETDQEVSETFGFPPEGFPVEESFAEPDEFEPEPEPAREPISDTLFVGDVEISRVLFELYITEAQTHIATLQQDFSHLADNPTLLLPESSLRAAHSCAGISGTAHCTPPYTLSKALELAQQRIHSLKRPPTGNELALFKTCAEMLDSMLTIIIGLQMPLETPELIDQLNRIGQEQAEAPKLVEISIEEAPAEAFPNSLLAARPGITVRQPSPTTGFLPAGHDDIDEQLLPIFLEEAGELGNALHTALHAWSTDLDNAGHPLLVKRLLHTLKGSARMVGAMDLGNRVHQLESRVEAAVANGEDIASLVDEMTSTLDGIEQMVAMLGTCPAPETTAQETPVAETADSSQAEPSDQPTALPADDTGRREPAAAPSSMPAPQPEKKRPAPAPRPAPTHAHMPAPTTEGEAIAALRVRAEMLDGFVNDASEIGVARTRIEGELRLLRRNLIDLTENVIRLRNQLREVEIQADTQMQTRIAQAESVHTEFDPLEMDRYTRLQELTRMMAESVNDVTTVQQNLLRNLDSADLALHSQARTTRELQQGLMQVRMVPFESLAVRLYRIVRRGAKDLGKRANLDLRGGGIEIDRSVLDHIIAPLEHLLRNSLAHGIEPPEARREKDKPEIGQITLTTRQEGNEIVIELADDGAGLDFERIAARARERGLIEPGEAVDDLRLANMIFLPGFTTAEKVTAVSGRGVGMDVVKAETAAVGGRVEVSSTPGAGTIFSIYLPLTLAVTQALLVRAGNQHFAIPASMISQIMELKVDAIERLRAEGSIEWLGQQYGYRYLPNLLGNPVAQPEIGRYSWVLLLHSGTQTLALHVDALRGHQEIIVKNAGPQLTRIAGMSGATVLGDGEIVLIINPIAMASRAALYGQIGKASSGTATPIEATPEPEAAHEPMVMVVDDSLTVRKITSRMLEREGYRVITAKDGVDAIECLIDNVPDVILSDIEMPRMDGFDLVRNIRADARLGNVPIIMITSRLADKHREYAREVGANHYLGKPYQEEELLGLIAGYTQRA